MITKNQEFLQHGATYILVRGSREFLGTWREDIQKFLCADRFYALRDVWIVAQIGRTAA